MQLVLDRVSLHFGQTAALQDVSLQVASGEVVCLLGDNGAGKSSLVRVLSGVHQPSAGAYRIDGVVTRFTSPRAALERGIATVHQDLGLIPLLSVWRNFVLGDEPARGRAIFKRIDRPHARAATSAALAELGIELRDADQPVGTLSGGERQSLAIARAIHRGARILILDEPTAALGVRQAALALNSVVQARQRGIGVVLVTHNPAHAFEAGDRFVVLRQGRVVADAERAAIDVARLADLMSGGRG
jgi:simple sugar transport system ATP-binding protein